VIKENNNIKTVEVDKIYYDGLRDIIRKAELVKTQDLGGMGLWSLENDSRDPAKSLLRQIKESL
jgi:GH18 family chitinase